MWKKLRGSKSKSRITSCVGETTFVSSTGKISAYLEDGKHLADPDHQKRSHLGQEMARAQCHCHVTNQRLKLAQQIVLNLKQDYDDFNRQYWHVWRRLLWPADIAIRYAVDDFEQMENKPDLWMYCAETGYRMTTKMSEDNPVDTLEQIIQSTRISYTTGSLENLTALQSKLEQESKQCEARYDRMQKIVESLNTTLRTHHNSSTLSKLMKPWKLNSSIIAATNQDMDEIQNKAAAVDNV